MRAEVTSHHSDMQQPRTSEHEVARRLWLIYELALNAAARAERQQANEYETGDENAAGPST